MKKSLASFSTTSSPQTSKADKDQVQNSAGGYTFEVSAFDRLQRFLTIGCDGGTYYAADTDLASANGQFIFEDCMSRGKSVVDQIVEVSTSYRAPKNSPALFALAIAASSHDSEVRKYALDNLPLVARTASHLFEFLSYLQNHRGWGRQVRSAVSAWYLSKDSDALAYQMTKYRQRSGWSHKDVLAKAHTKGEGVYGEIFKWAVTGKAPSSVRAISDFMSLSNSQDAQRIIRAQGSQVSHEMLSNELKNDVEVWKALIDADRIPLTALIRQLTKMRNVGVFEDDSYVKTVCERITDKPRLIRSGIHPVSVLQALVTVKNNGLDSRIVGALDDAFYLSFGNIPASEKRTLHAVDVSGSMGYHKAGGTVLSCSQAATALVQASLSANPDDKVIGFSHELIPLDISPKRRLDDTLLEISQIPFGATDCAAPIMYALEKGIAVDTFVIYTDNETYYGDIHPHQALSKYRKATGIDAKLVVAAFSSVPFTIADPKDPGMLDIAGFDSAVPRIIADF